VLSDTFWNVMDTVFRQFLWIYGIIKIHNILILSQLVPLLLQKCSKRTINSVNKYQFSDTLPISHTLGVTDTTD